MPSEIQAEVNNRLKSLYKHSFVGSATSGRSQRKRRQRSDDLTQRMLNDWVSDGRLTKRRRGVQDVQGDASNAAASGSASGTPLETVVMTGTTEKTVEVDVQTAAPEVRDPSPDVTVSCRFGASDLPRISPEDDRPASFLYSWECQAGKASLVQKLAFDVYKTDIPARRFLVSRTRTKNLYDLAAAWRASQINSLVAANAVAEDQVDAWD